MLSHPPHGRTHPTISEPHMTTLPSDRPHDRVAHALAASEVTTEPAAEESGPDFDTEAHEHVSNTERLITLTFVVVPFIGVVVAVVSLWGVGVSWLHLALLAGMYLITALGISVGYHRLFSHKAFKTHAFMRVFFAIIGAMAAEGTVRRFVANHRRHHGHSDREGDPHSPHHHDDDEHGVWGTIKGFFHAHVGWFLKKREHPDEAKYAPEFVKPSGVRFVDKTNAVWVTLGLAIPTAIGSVWGGLTDGTWVTSGVLGLLWGGIVRIFVVHHVTWSINSVCHLWGTRPFKSGDHSRNNAIFGVLGVGEGWHNNHHAFPYSSRHGLRWWEFDAGWVVIRTLKALRLAWDVRVPAKERLEKARG